MMASLRALRIRSRTCFASLATLALAAAAACDAPPQYLRDGQFGEPKGVIDGIVTYSGPLPCTKDGRILGAAPILLFDTRLLPPPEGVGTTATSIAVVRGEDLFAGVRGRLTFNDNGSLWCPDANKPHVVVSAPWAASPLEAGTYQVRGFYDRDGDFDPGFLISNLPTMGDVGGGAIDNPTEVLQGKAPRYREISIGALGPNGERTIPETGARIGGVTVTLGLPLPLERPVFYTKELLDETSVMNTDPLNVHMPSDFQLGTFSALDPGNTEKSFIRLKLGAGVPDAEIDAAAKSPFNMPVKDPAPFFLFTRQDVNGDGILDANDHIPDSAQVPSLYPLSIFSKLSDESDVVSQTAPVIVMQGITIYQSLLNTAFSLPDLNDAQPEAIVALRPAALCIKNPLDPKAEGVLVVSHPDDTQGNKVITDEPAVEAALSAQFHRPVKIAYGCLPQGRYAMNLIYPTGQAWTVPNEAGECTGLEEPTSDGKRCSLDPADPQAANRPLIPSQAAVLIVDKPTDGAYCQANPTPDACK